MTGFRAVHPGYIPSWASEFCLFTIAFTMSQRSSQRPRPERPGYRSKHVSPFSVELKNAWNHSFAPASISLTWCDMKQKDKLQEGTVVCLNRGHRKLRRTSFCPRFEPDIYRIHSTPASSSQKLTKKWHNLNVRILLPLLSEKTNVGENFVLCLECSYVLGT
jgi:hypothetical protein